MSDIGLDPVASDYAALMVEVHGLKRRVAELETSEAAWRKDADMWHDQAHALQRVCDEYARADVARDRIPVQPWTPRPRSVTEGGL